MSHRGLAWVVAGVMLAVLVTAPPAAALPGEIAVVRLAGRPAGAELRVRGHPVARVYGASAAARLAAAARALDPLLPPPTAVRTQVSRTEASVVVDGRVVLTALRGDAARSGLRLAALAGRWAEALETALAVPPIVLSRTALVLSPGGSAVIAVTTVAPGGLQLGGFDRSVVTVTLRAGEVHLVAGGAGSTIVPVRWGPYRAQVAVSVRPPAGVIPAESAVVVTGTPATPELIRAAVQRRLQETVERGSGTTMEHGPITVEGPLAPGGAAVIPVTVALRSPTAGPVDGIVRVRVTNAPVELADPHVLLVSNRPETITGNGLLFHDTLEPGRPARLLYHHLNGPPAQPRVLKITLTNPGAARAQVHYLSGHAGPSPDPLHVGFAATARFLDALLASRGYVVDVPARGTATFTAYTLAPLALVSGLMQFQVIEGGPVDLVVQVRLPWLLDGTVTTDLGPWAFPHPRGTFPGSVVELAREVAVHLPAPVGDLGIASGLRDVRTGEPLVGDYGVVYRLRLRVVNPTGREATASLVATAAGGLARGLFIVDGVPVDLGLMRAFEEREVAVVTVGPLAVRELLVVTMPIAGSFYPVRLGLRPR